MNSKILYIYDFNKLFEILNEIKTNLNFEISNIDKKAYEKIDFNNLQNYLIIKKQNCNNIKNCFEFKDMPIKIDKLIEKININFLKNQFNNQSEVKIGKYILDLNSRKINFNNVRLDLTEKESDLILFINSKTKASLKEIQTQVWGYSPDLETHTVETHIYRLRKKILKSFKDNNFINHDKEGYFIN